MVVVDRPIPHLVLGGPPMMDDHFIISRARNHLADALKALLNADIMDATDFARSRDAALAAVSELDVLLRQSHRHPAKP
jgi:hypothetical protein